MLHQGQLRKAEGRRVWYHPQLLMTQCCNAWAKNNDDMLIKFARNLLSSIASFIFADKKTRPDI